MYENTDFLPRTLLRAQLYPGMCVLFPQSLKRKVRGGQQSPHEFMKLQRKKCENELGTQEQ